MHFDLTRIYRFFLCVYLWFCVIMIGWKMHKSFRYFLSLFRVYCFHVISDRFRAWKHDHFGEKSKTLGILSAHSTQWDVRKETVVSEKMRTPEFFWQKVEYTKVERSETHKILLYSQINDRFWLFFFTTLCSSASFTQPFLFRSFAAHPKLIKLSQKYVLRENFQRVFFSECVTSIYRN